jgi:hypothetical protein
MEEKAMKTLMWVFSFISILSAQWLDGLPDSVRYVGDTIVSTISDPETLQIEVTAQNEAALIIDTIEIIANEGGWMTGLPFWCHYTGDTLICSTAVADTGFYYFVVLSKNIGGGVLDTIGIEVMAKSLGVPINFSGAVVVGVFVGVGALIGFRRKITTILRR